MRDKTIIAVSAGLFKAKKDFNPLNKRNRYLNYGLLGIVSELKNLGHTTIMFQGDYEEPEEILNRIQRVNVNLNNLQYPILLSIPSYFAVPWAKEFCKIIKQNFQVKIIVGGRWVLQDEGNWIRSKIEEIDLTVDGFGEGILEEIFEDQRWLSGKTHHIHGLIKYDNVKCFNNFDYSILHGYLEYQPCIEVSRGCGFKCSFCLERKVPLSKMKKPESLINEVKDITRSYNIDNLNFYFEASHFKPTINWSKEFKQKYLEDNLVAKWRCETRVDSMSPEIVKELSQAGLKVLDIGLESASKNQLELMNKARNPEEYLNKARKLLEACFENNVWAKVNVLLFAGETQKTIMETMDWLQSMKDTIKGVSVNPLVLYGQDQSFLDFKKLGASLVNERSLVDFGYAFLNLSEEINYEKSEEICIQIGKSLMTKEDYFDLKSVTYFSRNYSYKEFLLDISNCNIDKLPFDC